MSVKQYQPATAPMNFKLGFKLSNWSKYVYALYLFGTNLSFGIIFAFFPAIMVDMKHILDTTMTLISIHPVLETVGYTLGAFAGLTYKWLNRQLVMAVWFVIICAVSAVTPLVGDLWALYVIALVMGFGSSINVGGYVVWTIEMWNEKSAPVLQMNALGFGLGSVICTSILAPYLTGELQDNSLVTNQERRNKLMVPSIILCAVLCAVPLVSLVMYFIKPYRITDNVSDNYPKGMELELEAPQKLFDDPRTPRTWMRVLLAFWFILYVLSETMFLKFAITYYQYCPHKLSAEDAARLFSYSTIAYAAFRLVNVFVSMRVTINTIIKTHYVVLLVGTVLMTAAHFNQTCLWVSGPVMLWGFSPMFAGTYTFAAKYLTMSDQLSTAFLFGRGIFTLFTPSIIGEFIEQYSYVFIVVEIAYIMSSLVLFIIINMAIAKYEKRIRI